MKYKNEDNTSENTKEEKGNGKENERKKRDGRDGRKYSSIPGNKFLVTALLALQALLRVHRVPLYAHS